MFSIFRTKGNCLDIPQLSLLQILKQFKFCSWRKKAEEPYLRGLPENSWLHMVKFYEKENTERQHCPFLHTYIFLNKRDPCCSTVSTSNMKQNSQTLQMLNMLLHSHWSHARKKYTSSKQSTAV